MLLTKIRQKLLPNAFEREVARFYADGGEKTLRYDYPLDANSVVLDLGGYQGDWAARIHSRYGCSIDIFEPIASFSESIRGRFSGNPQIIIHQFGLGGPNTATVEFLDSEPPAVKMLSEDVPPEICPYTYDDGGGHIKCPGRAEMGFMFAGKTAADYPSDDLLIFEGLAWYKACSTSPIPRPTPGGHAKPAGKPGALPKSP